MKKEKICNHCQKHIDLEEEKFVLLGTYQKDNILDESYFHWQCFNLWYNSRVKEKAENVIKGVSKKVSGMLGGLRKMAINNSGDQAVVDMGFNMSNEIPNMEEEIPDLDFSKFSDKIKKKKDGKKKKR